MDQSGAGGNVSVAGGTNGEVPTRTAVPPSSVLTDAHTAELAEAYHRALVNQLLTAHDSFGLREAVTGQAQNLVDLAAELMTTPWRQHPLFTEITDDESAGRLLLAMTGRIAPLRGTQASALTRPAAARVSDILVSRARIGGEDSNWTLLDEALFCELYRLFFADAITGFLAGVIAAKITVALPILPVLDPTGQIAAYLGEMIAEAIPTPCEEKAEKRPSDSLTDVAQDLVTQTFDRWLDTAAQEAA